MTMGKHRWYDVIVSWAEGKEIEFSWNYNNWQTFNYDLSTPNFDDPCIIWRVKPKNITKKFRMALLQDDTVIAVDITNNTLDDPIEYNIRGFKSWIGTATEVITEEKT